MENPLPKSSVQRESYPFGEVFLQFLNIGTIFKS